MHFISLLFLTLLVLTPCVSCASQDLTPPSQVEKPEVVIEDCVKLSVPKNGVGISLEDGKDAHILFQWLTEEYGVSCQLSIADNVDMENAMVLDCGSSARYSISHATLDTLLANSGIPEYKRGQLWWTVSYRQGRYTLTSAPNSLILYRICRPFKDPRDNNEYKVCRIIDAKTGQYMVWLAENLRATTYSDGTPLNEGSYGFYKDNKELSKVYGAYYTWDAAMGDKTEDPVTGYVQGIAPEGWHLPAVSEWNFLRIAADKGRGAPCELMDAVYWNPDSKNVGTNSFGFNAVGSGYVYRMPMSVLSGRNESSFFWSSDCPQPGDSYGGVSDPEKFKGTALTCGITKDRPALPIYFYEKDRGMSVRCVLD